MNTCRICGSQNLKSFTALEMQHGTRDAFLYDECLACKSLQIQNIPEDLGKYYPSDYYSFNKSISTDQSSIKSSVKSVFSNLFLHSKFLKNLEPMAKYAGVTLKKIAHSRVDKHSKILDVGCGNGEKLVSLAKYGFKNLTGIDPFLSNDIDYSINCRIVKESIYDHSGSYDLIMFSHVLEHVESPRDVLEKSSNLLKEGGTLQITIPVADSYAWKKYRENWVALDAPRHIHLFSPSAFKAFVDSCGFHVYKEVYESTEYQFYGSEQYKKGIPLRSETSYYDHPDRSIFSESDIHEFKKKADKLNQEKQGDIVCFYLAKN